MSNQEAFWEVARGFLFSLAIIGIFLFLVILFGNKEIDPVEKFKVVDKYKGCEVIRYTDSTGRWDYLLDCNGK